MNQILKKVISIILTSTCLLNVTACSSEVGTISLNKISYPTKIVNYDNRDFIDNVNSFGSKTSYKVLNGEDDKSKNINYSPISLFFCLSMLASGSNGATEKDMMTLFNMSDKDKGYLSSECNKLFNSLYSNNKDLKLLLADSIWMQNGLAFKDEFMDNVAKNFYASTFNIDNNNQEDVDKIGKWVQENTNNLLSPKFEASKETILRLVNTIYFKSSWEQEFDSKKNYEDIFNAKDEDITCTYMCANLDNNIYVEGDNYTCSSLNMKSGRMYFVRPNDGTDVFDLISAENSLDDIMNYVEDSFNVKYNNVIFSLPKFTIKSNLDLKNYIKELGCTSIFDNADFSNITDEDLFVSSIMQGTYMDVNEKGAEAAAYTSIECKATSMPSDSVEFRLDKPFIYVLVSDNGTILFVGICNNPLEN